MLETITRAFVWQDAVVRGRSGERTVEAVCVPYWVPTVVRDGGGDPYMEMFAAGAFDEQLGQEGQPGRVSLRWQHRDSVMDWLGRGVRFESFDDHLRGTFAMFDGPVGEQALAILDGSEQFGVSVGFRALNSTRMPDGTVRRDRASLVEVSLTPTPAYQDAKVLAVRDGHVEVVETVADKMVAEVTPQGTPALDEALSWLAQVKAYDLAG